MHPPFAAKSGAARSARRAPRDASADDRTRAAMPSATCRPTSIVGVACPPYERPPADVNCTSLVSEPIDASPIRSPQTLHSHIAARIRQKTVVEIGTRNGDGMACIAQVAARATAIEASGPYCDKLRRRAATLPGPAPAFSVLCSRYQRANPLPSADVYTWWQQWPHLTDGTLLGHLRTHQVAGRIGASAVALIAFDLSWPLDRRSWRSLAPRATWARRVAYDERAACVVRAGQSNKMRKLCEERAHGAFILAELPIAGPAAPATAAGESAAHRGLPAGRRLRLHEDGLAAAAAVGSRSRTPSWNASDQKQGSLHGKPST